MNISYKWLKEYVDFDLTAQQVADALTSTGLEIDVFFQPFIRNIHDVETCLKFEFACKGTKKD